MSRPNIILISIDTLRADHLSCYGYHKKTTPHIDRIAGEGTIFRRNYSTGVWTPPGHASMLTGLYVSEHGVHGENRLNKNIPTIATKLKENGYQTSGFVNNSQVGELVGFDKGHDTFMEIWKGEKPGSTAERIIKGVKRRIRKKLGYEDMGARKTNDLFKSWVVDKIDRSSPFYTFLHYIEPHNPLSPPRTYKNKFMNKPLKNVDMKKIEKVAYNPLVCYIEDQNLNKEEIELLKVLYDSEIAYTDSIVGEIIDILKKEGMYDNTMIIITSDHGEHFGEHGHWSHVASLYNEVLHIPLIIKFPKDTKHISEVNACTQLVDIFPTVMEITGVPFDNVTKTSGVSLVYGSNNETSLHHHVFAEWEGRVPYFIQNRLDTPGCSVNISNITNKMWMVSDGEQKYIYADNGNREFYDLKKDINEQNNLIDQNRESADKMAAVLSEWRKASGAKEDQEQREMNEETKKNLEALGYM